MHNASIVSVGNRLANRHKRSQQLTELNTLLGCQSLTDAGLMIAHNGFIHRLAVDVTHVVKQTAILCLTDAVQRNNARMFEPPGDFRLQQKTSAAVAVLHEI